MGHIANKVYTGEMRSPQWVSVLAALLVAVATACSNDEDGISPVGPGADASTSGGATSAGGQHTGGAAGGNSNTGGAAGAVGGSANTGGSIGSGGNVTTGTGGFFATGDAGIHAACGTVPPIEATPVPIPPNNIPQPNATLQEVVISGASSTYAVGTAGSGHVVFIQAQELYSDGTVRGMSSVTWTSSDPAIASVQKDNVAPTEAEVQGYRAGVVTITATVDGVSKSGCFVVTPPIVSSLVIAAPSLTTSNPNGPFIVSGGDTVSLTCTRIMTDGSKADVTTEVAWVSSDTNVATISPTGSAHALSPGSTNVTATLPASVPSTNPSGPASARAVLDVLGGTGLQQGESCAAPGSVCAPGLGCCVTAPRPGSNVCLPLPCPPPPP